MIDYVADLAMAAIRFGLEAGRKLRDDRPRHERWRSSASNFMAAMAIAGIIAAER